MSVFQNNMRFLFSMSKILHNLTFRKKEKKVINYQVMSKLWWRRKGSMGSVGTGYTSSRRKSSLESVGLWYGEEEMKLRKDSIGSAAHGLFVDEHEFQYR